MAKRGIKIEPDVADIVILLRMMKLNMDTYVYKKDRSRAVNNYIEITSDIISCFDNITGSNFSEFMNGIWPEICKLDRAMGDLKIAVGKNGVLFLDDRLRFRKVEPPTLPSLYSDA